MPEPGRAAGGLVRIATRGSALALAQSRIVEAGLRAAWPGLEVALVGVVTAGVHARGGDTQLRAVGARDGPEPQALQLVPHGGVAGAPLDDEVSERPALAVGAPADDLRLQSVALGV